MITKTYGYMFGLCLGRRGAKDLKVEEKQELGCGAPPAPGLPFLLFSV